MSSPDAPASASAGLLSDATLAALELRRQPFTDTPADGDHYTDDTTAEQLADIRQALITGDDLLLILGPRGAGKSTLLAQLAANSGLRIQCFSVRGSPRFSTQNLFAGMLEAFREQPGDELRDVLDALVPHLQRMTNDNVLCTVVLDDADAVSEAELTRLLSGMLYLNSRDETLLRIALAAEEAFEERIPELLPEGADLPYSGLVMEPFGAERAAGYLDFRLNQAGRFDAFPFSEREVEALNSRAGGLPLLLHAEAAQELNERHDVGADEPLPAELAEHARAGASRGAAGGEVGLAGLLGTRGGKLALGGLALALILGGLLLSRPSSEPVDTARYTVVEERPVGAAAAGEGADGADRAGADEARLRLVRELEESRAADLAAATASAPATRGEPVRTAPLDGSASVDAESGTGSVEPGPEAGEEGVAAAPPTEPEPPPEPASAPAELPDATVARADSEPLPAPAPAPSDTPAPAAALPDAEPTPAPEPEPEPAPGPAPAVALPSAEEDVPAALESLESPNWVLVQDPERFTVQMSASTEKSTVEDFLVRTGLSAPNSIFAFDRDGTTWYALVHGLFGSIEEAREAIERMPPDAQTNQPWIRGVGRIQAALKEAN